ncbi:hypothetical protein LJC33_08965, partial [Eubacteriales bacterium OttesenSCG-928-N13]|nr:hypothetical protein [Eubacteriales bacterium OttesenSCG-928-N13]
EQHQLLRDRGVQLIHPPYALTGVDLPVLGAEVTRIFAAPALKTVLDVGGNDAGAAALGVYKQHFDQQSADMYYVVNLFRPFSETREQIIELLQRIERRARMKPAGLINNANLGDWTDIDQIIEGQRVLEDVSKALDLPIVAITGKQDVLKRLPQMDATLYPIERLLKPEWMEN